MLCPICQSQNPATTSTCNSCGAPLTSAAISGERLPSGATLQHGAYVVDRVLGQGGFGITYLGSDTHLGRAVAIKEFFPTGCYRDHTTVQPSGALPPADFDSARQRFLEEARTLARFRHPGIVNVFAAFEEHNTAYMVMEYLLGKTLGTLVQERGRLEEAEAIKYIRAAGDALGVVHEAGLLHRDIKPENLMLCHDGRIVLIDFGTARDFAPARTQGHTVVVTPGYAPLEQYAQRAQRGVFSDVYGLAATLFFLLTGEAPVPATDRAAGVEFVPPHHIVSSVSRTVGEAVQWAMELRVEQRPQSVQEFIQGLITPRSSLSQSTVPVTRYAPHSHEPAQSAIEAWRYSKQAVNPDKPLSVVVHEARLQQTHPPPPPPVLTQPIVYCTGGASLYVEGSDKDGRPLPLIWPQQCACCNESSFTSTLPVTYTGDPNVARIIPVWQVPYCVTCVHHIEASEIPTDHVPGKTVAAIFASLFGSLGGTAFLYFGTPILAPEAPLITWGVGSAIGSIISVRRSRSRRAALQKPECHAVLPAVRCTHIVRGSYGQAVYTLEFENGTYREAFEQLNNAIKGEL